MGISLQSYIFFHSPFMSLISAEAVIRLPWSLSYSIGFPPQIESVTGFLFQVYPPNSIPRKLVKTIIHRYFDMKSPYEAININAWFSRL